MEFCRFSENKYKLINHIDKIYAKFTVFFTKKTKKILKQKFNKSIKMLI